MEERIKSREQLGSRTTLLAAVLLFVSGFCAWWGLPLLTESKEVVMRVGTDGVARVYGIPLANRSLRKAALSILARSEAKVRLDWQPPGGEQGIGKPFTMGGATRAQLELLHAMAKAGVTNSFLTFSTNAPAVHPLSGRF